MSRVSPIYATKDIIEWCNWSKPKKKAHVDSKQF